ncbi:DUF6101 family protein [Hansschlegelia plantiphila]|uniref:Uncharacterized protein n=1 Tax=Hansschlegelia plantiphila TaxID=374655 RepID=A0A9W6IYX2_9HYPH|nr:DUF6101 family protein [Hansschlegelia plantiphila]GLK67711.1 hypothetical protein GCM10008179_13490 [Hansschlegelia plantiphila]
MGRLTGTGARACAATGSADRLDPFALPHRFAAPDAAADGGERRVTLESGRVVVDRMVRSMVMRIAVPLVSFSGVAMRVAPGDKPEADRVEVVLAHRDRALDVPLATEPFDGDGFAEWRSWGRSLNLPLLIEDLDGTRKTPSVHLGALEVGRPRARRRHSLLKGRRTRFQAKRKTGELTAETPVHRDEREIIARN